MWRAANLEAIAALFDQNALNEEHIMKTARLARDRNMAWRLAVTWRAAAVILRSTTIDPSLATKEHQDGAQNV